MIADYRHTGRDDFLRQPPPLSSAADFRRQLSAFATAG